MRLGVLVSHPIQYYTPLFKELARRLDLHVYYAHRQTREQQANAGFGVEFEWDVDLLEGHPHTFLENQATHPSISRFFGCDTPEIRTHIREKTPDAFLVTGWHLKCYWQAVRACHRQNVPVLVRGDSHLKTARSFAKKMAMEMTHRLLIRQFDGFFVVGQRSREYLSYYGADREDMFRVPHFVDNEWFRQKAEQARPQRSALRSHWGAGDGTTVLLFVGKFIPEKQPVDLIRAADLLHKRGQSVTVVYVGAGPLTEELHEAAQESAVDVRFAGFKNQTELPRYYASADVLALPSGSETWGLVVNEAMACGTPAVVSEAVGCAPDLVEEGKTGARFPAGEVSEFVAAIQRLIPKLGSEEVREALAHKVRAHSCEAAVEGVLEGMRQVS